MLVELIYKSSHRNLELWSASSVKRSTQFPLVLVFIIQHNIARGKTERTNEQHMSRIRDIMHKCLIRAFSHELGAVSCLVEDVLSGPTQICHILFRIV